MMRKHGQSRLWLTICGTGFVFALVLLTIGIDAQSPGDGCAVGSDGCKTDFTCEMGDIHPGNHFCDFYEFNPGNVDCICVHDDSSDPLVPPGCETRMPASECDTAGLDPSQPSGYTAAGMDLPGDCGSNDWGFYSPFTLVAGDPGAPAFSTGMTYDIRRLNELEARAHYPTTYGGGQEDITIPDVFASFVVGDPVDGEPNLVRIHARAFSTTIPSFASISLDSAQTGVNRFNLDSLENSFSTTVTERVPNSGTLDTTTGNFECTLYLSLVNSHFPSSSPAKLMMRVVGELDESTGQAQVAYRAYYREVLEGCGT